MIRFPAGAPAQAEDLIPVGSMQKVRGGIRAENNEIKKKVQTQ